VGIGQDLSTRRRRRSKIPVIGVRTGGFSVGELHEGGVLQVFDSLVVFRQVLDGTPLACASR
jgi:hypothetical protein